jgi:hypothetical protein
MTAHRIIQIALRTRALPYFVAGAVALSATLAGPAGAALLAYDPFLYGDDPSAGEYAPGDEDAGIDVIGGQNPVIGPTAFYFGPWIQAGGDAQVVKALPSLSYPDLLAGLGGVQQETLQFECCTFGRSGREIEAGLGAGRNRTIYESFLVDFGSQGTDAPTDFGFRGHELWNGGVGNSFAAVQLFINHFSGTNTLSLAVTTPSGTSTVPVAGGGLDLATLETFNGGTHLVVMKFEFAPGAADVVSVYFDPATGIEPALPDAQISVAASDLIITHQGAFTNFTFSGAGHVPGTIDEIRWGDTYADVTPIPEPTTLSLLGLGLLALHRSAARRRS